ncbi:hypothetical protein ATO67_18015 [Agrobacterium bohemicum]|uniref:Uncharacterized protein n=1 Tax=Agrobacterium bohemicum TaxID=2052828 RepID=A0A135P7Z8_9HYPH|nr:hypothetical protein ATO67_18015 [Agrobacterium bohemicum]
MTMVDDIVNNPTEIMISVMHLQEEAGLMRGLASFIRRNDETIRKQASQGQLARSVATLQRAEVAFELERAHGSGSLLKLGHPFVRLLISTRVVDVRNIVEAVPPSAVPNSVLAA